MKKSRKKSNHDLIEDIMNDFDFDKVRKVMVVLNWHWSQVEQTPTVDEMKRTARRLLRDLCENDEIDFVSTGGFEASKRDGGLELRFIAEEAWGPINGDGVIKGLIK
jgi:hypothetical protein